MQLADVKPNMYGQFYGGDCYLVLYTYLNAGQQHYILYMWEVSDSLSVTITIKNNQLFHYTAEMIVQGRHASKDEIEECAKQADIIDDKYKGAPLQVRVVMGKEPRHFLAMFKGKFIIYEVRYLTRKIPGKSF